LYWKIYYSLIPISISPSFEYSIHLYGYIILPFLQISQSDIHFEPTHVGQTQVQCFQIQNHNPVQVSYSISSTIKEFQIEPKNDFIPPHSFINVSVLFIPSSNEEFQIILMN
jgi:hypothetical protein